VVIGSGFGGAVTALRLSKQFGDQVLIVERGRRYPKGSFARDLGGLVNSFWRQKDDQVPRPISMAGEAHGVFDLRSYSGMDTLVASGWGGGSLIYAAAMVEPQDPNFDKDWPSSIKRENLAYYYRVFKKMIGAQPVPQNEVPRRLIRHDLFATAAQETGAQFSTVDVAIHFGKDPELPDPMGLEGTNRYGAKQTSCQYCAECILGCNYHAKNSLDLNYLYAAEHHYGAEVKTEHQVEKIVPLDSMGVEDSNADGTNGFHVYLKPINHSTDEFDYLVLKSKRVIVAAGVYGTNELLLRNRDLHKSLPRISSQLGSRYSGNGDFLNLVFGAKKEGSHFGPTLTLKNQYQSVPAENDSEFIIEDLAFPSNPKLLSWMVKIFEPKTPLGRKLLLPVYQKIMESLQANNPESGKMTILLGVGIDKSDGVMTLGSAGRLRLNWKSRTSKKLYERMISVSQKIKKIWKADAVIPFPTYLLGRNLTVHPLGGCVLADTPLQGVVDADPHNFGAVFNYRNLYVADGSIIPSALGANPALTIGALAEMVAEGITGDRP
jgi:cholesterol oxidase